MLLTFEVSEYVEINKCIEEGRETLLLSVGLGKATMHPIVKGKY